MTKAISILVHAIKMIFADLAATAGAVAPGGVVVLIAIAVANVMGVKPGALNFETPEEMLALVPAILTAGIIFAVGLVMVIVNWHRYVLLSGTEQGPGALPPLGPVLRYIGVAVLLGLVMIAASIAISIPGGIAVVIHPALGALVFIALTVGLAWFLMRLSLALPAVSIGATLNIWDSLQRTAPANKTILWLAIFSVAIGAALGNAPAALPFDGIVTLILELVANLLILLINASILTTLYGWLVEGRDVPG